VNLRLYHPYAAAQCLRGCDCFVNTETCNAARRDNAKSAQYFLCLIFVNLHGLPCSLRMADCTAPPAPPVHRACAQFPHRNKFEHPEKIAVGHRAWRRPQLPARAGVADDHAAGKTRKYI
jgi:hypothetical protein